MSKEKKQIAIIGLGPRGLYSLENLIYSLGKKEIEDLKIILFEENKSPGSGSVYDTEQTASNWINLNERSLILNQREEKILSGVTIKSFPSYHEWADLDYSEIENDKIDTYPARSKIGRYLNKRYSTLMESLEEGIHFKMINERAVAIDFKDGIVNVKTENKDSYVVDEVLLTIGHQPTFEDDQIKAWKKHVDQNSNLTLYTYPYPISQFENIISSPENKSLAIRGFGLATIDVIRGISEEIGAFNVEKKTTRKLSYQSNKKLKNLFVPFSLDGLPMSPKPINQFVDDLYKPSEGDIKAFKLAVENSETQKEAVDAGFIVDAILPLITSIFIKLRDSTYDEKTVSQIIKQWLKDEKFDHPLIVNRDNSAKIMMQSFIAMATADEPPSLDYCVGQVWRHCQPSMYKALSFNECSGEAITKVIGLDERLKRYSYGPPVESLQQMLALISCGILNLDFVKDPDIETSPDGWKLEKDSKSILATYMVDSVLDAPKLTNVKSPIIQSLIDNAQLKLVHDDLGVETDVHGYLTSESNDRKIPIALIGRLAKGTIVGTDAILECFGEGPKLWARKVVSNL